MFSQIVYVSFMQFPCTLLKALLGMYVKKLMHKVTLDILLTLKIKNYFQNKYQSTT